MIELLAVVVITGILALAGVTLFKHQLDSSKGSEAIAVIQAIRSAEEAYKAENHVYKNVSLSGKWYPKDPDKRNSSWVLDTHADYDKGWKVLAPAVNRSVMFGYQVYAGVSGSTVPNLGLIQDPGFPSPMPLDWYVIRAHGDVNGNSLFADYAASSMSSEVVIENEGE